jgi:transmembrane sensor
MSKRELSADIDDVAAEWVARGDRAPLTPQEAEALQAWLEGDVRRLGAYAKARAVLAHFDRAKALGPGYAPERFGAAPPARMPLRRTLLLGGGAAIAAGAMVMFLGAGQRVRTRRGEVRLAPLADGSQMTLNTASTVQVHFTATRRHVSLIEGEALFDVAKDPKRPFVVEAGGVQVRAVGTSFSVRRRPARSVEVVVREGVVEVSGQALTPAAPTRLAANDRALVTEGGPIRAVALAPAQVAQGLAWREGMIDLEGVSLGEAASEFGRYSDTQILIDDPAVAQMTITGLFSANNPAGFARAAAISLGLRAETDPDGVHLSR